MVLAYHVIFCLYGFWLPNDPRGSWSDFVGAWELLRFGGATKTNARRSLAGNRHNRELRNAAKQALKYPPVSLTGVRARAVARGFSRYVNLGGITVHACSILPEHVHMVIGRHDFKIESVVNQLKGYATRQLIEEGLHPFADLAKPGDRPPTCWARGQWKVFLDESEGIERACHYVRNNPVKEGLPEQTYRFVLPVV